MEGKYTDRRHPDSVKWAERLEDDLRRRDFSVNAMAYNPKKGELIDLFDYLILKFELLKHYVNTSADFDGNGVGMSDFNIWKNGFVNNP